MAIVVRNRHVHEFLTSTKVARNHTHRIAGVTDRAIHFASGSHIHRFKTNTDFARQHYHKASGVTGRAIPLRNGRHTHYIKSVTTFDAATGTVINWRPSLKTPIKKFHK